MKTRVSINSVLRRYHVGIFAVALLAGCAPFPPPASKTSFRDQAVPIASTTRFDEVQFSGRWFRVAYFSESEPRDVTPWTWEFEAREGSGIGISNRCVIPTLPPQSYVEVATARFEPNSFMLKNQPPIWVLWVDADYRTAVLGTPSGSFGVILNRSPEITADRMRAAREILDFNGYDVSQLKVKK